MGRYYEDCGEGYGYRNGDYADYRLEAKAEGKQLIVSLHQTAGQRQCPIRWLRIGQLVGGKVIYSPWQQGQQAIAKLR